MKITLYGISNCDSVKKSRQWFENQGIAYVFHDFKKLGVPEDRAKAWLEKLGTDAVINKKGTTWRKLSPELQSSISNAANALALIQVEPSLIKRPVIECLDREPEFLTIGYAPRQWLGVKSQTHFEANSAQIPRH